MHWENRKGIKWVPFYNRRCIDIGVTLSIVLSWIELIALSAC
jgi:hypothetical protein